MTVPGTLPAPALHRMVVALDCVREAIAFVPVADAVWTVRAWVHGDVAVAQVAVEARVRIWIWGDVAVAVECTDDPATWAAWLLLRVGGG